MHVGRWEYQEMDTEDRTARKNKRMLNRRIRDDVKEEMEITWQRKAEQA